MPESDITSNMTNELIYQPLIQSLIQSQPKKATQPVIGTVTQQESEPFPVEPVREWVQPEDFNWKAVIQPKPDNYVGERVGKVYKASEQEQFKSDLYNAYLKALKARGFKDEEASDFAKRIVAQDALESGYGTSSLSKIYNFGGIKDFRSNSDSLKVDTKEHIDGKLQTVKQPFRKFKNLDEYVNYKLDLLGNSNYDVFSHDPDQMYHRLTSAKKKYATDPRYERKLNNIYNML